MWNFESAVAPFTGAWIEIGKKPLSIREWTVAPFTGAWIEIVIAIAMPIASASRSLHGGVD